MKLLARISRPVQTAFYVVSGLNHFWHRPFYVHIMPDHYANPEVWVELTGVAEILGGVGLSIPAVRRPASIGLAFMLTVFLDVHIFMLRNSQRFPDVPRWILWARLPLQGLLIAWALQSGRENGAHARENC